MAQDLAKRIDLFTTYLIHFHTMNMYVLLALFVLDFTPQKLNCIFHNAR